MILFGVKLNISVLDSSNYVRPFPCHTSILNPIVLRESTQIPPTPCIREYKQDTSIFDLGPVLRGPTYSGFA